MSELSNLYRFLLGKKFKYAKTMIPTMILRVLVKDHEQLEVDTSYKDNRLNVEIDKNNYVIKILSIG